MSLLFNGISLTPESNKRVGFFLKIEEVQLSTFLVICNRVKPDFILDIGANVGFYTVISRKYFPKLDIFSFEPTPETFMHLRKNIENNSSASKGTVNALNIAVSSTTGNVEFMDFGDLSGKNSIVQTSIHGVKNLREKIQIKSDTLDNMYSYQNKRLLFKIDTEGHEVEVLKGGGNLFVKNSCVIQIETGYSEKQDFADKLLSESGYKKIFSLGPDKYYTNISDLMNTSASLAILEEATNFIIAQRWNIDVKF